MEDRVLADDREAIKRLRPALARVRRAADNAGRGLTTAARTSAKIGQITAARAIRRRTDMEYDNFPGPDGLEIRLPRTDDYRTCSECGAECSPDPAAGGDGIGARIAFVCPAHGVNAIVDPFEDFR